MVRNVAKRLLKSHVLLSAPRLLDEGTKPRAMSLLRNAKVTLLAAPTIIALFYFGLIASDRYVSEAQFIVRGVSTHRQTGLEMLFRTFGISRVVDDTNAVQNYMISRDAVRALEARLPLRIMFSDKKGDYFARYPYFWQIFRRESFERLFEYYVDHVIVIQDSSKGITTLKVVTFDAGNSQKIANELFLLAEQIVNAMNARAQQDAVRVARAELSKAEERLINAQLELTAFRNREVMIDPAKNSLSVLETITHLSRELADTATKIEAAENTASSSPAIRSWRAKVQALSEQIANERSKIAGGDTALAPRVAQYEQLALERELAEKALSAASASLEAARQEARRQQIYIEEITKPGLADEATEPRRLRSIVTVIMLTLAVATIIWILSVGAKEHAN